MIYFDNKEFKQQGYNTYILYKHLSLKYSPASAKKIINQNHDKLAGIAKALGKEDITFFCLYFLQDNFVVKDDNEARNLALVHLEIWEELNKMFVADLFDKEEFILPRGCSKSTIINKALSCWLHCYLKSRYTIVIGNKESDAVQFIADTRKMLENKYIVESFGQLTDKKNRTLNKQEIELTNNSKIQAFSWGSSCRGTTYGCSEGIFRPSCVICDDVLSQDDILSDNAKEKVLDKYYKEIAEVGDTEVIRNGIKIKSATKFLVIGTPLAQDDFINAVKEDSTFKVFHRKVVDFDIDEYFETNEYWIHYKKILNNTKIDKEDKDILLIEYYSTNKKYMIFPTIWEKYQCDKLAQKYFTQRIAFNQELMCDCENIGEKWFKSNRTQPTIEIESNDFIKTMLAVDPAGIKNKKRGDHFAFVVGSTAQNDFKYIRKGEILHFVTFDEYINHVIKILKEFEDITHVAIEKNTYMGLDLDKLKEEIAKDDELSRRNLTFINEQTFKNKDEKISTVVDDINNGRIIFDEARVMKEAIEQMMEFQGQKYTTHDDFIDCVAELCSRIDKIEIRTKMTFLDRNLLF